MARWAYTTVPLGIAVVIGAWCMAEPTLGTPEPDLGTVIVVTPHSSPTPVSTPEPDAAATVPPALPPPAGGEEPVDSDDDPDSPDGPEDEADDGDE